MATREITPKARRGRNRPGKGKAGDTEAKVSRDRSNPLPEVLHEAIEDERSNLSKAEAVLGCLMISMEYEADPDDGPYYPEVAQLARDLVKQSIDHLDSVALQKRLIGNKIREGTGLPWVEGAYRVSDCILVNVA